MNRRDLLKSAAGIGIGSSAAASSVIGRVAARRATIKGGFDPNDDDAVARYIYKVISTAKELNEKYGEEAQDQSRWKRLENHVKTLSQEERNAIEDYLKENTQLHVVRETSIETDRTSTDEVTSAASMASYTDSISGYIDIYACATVPPVGNVCLDRVYAFNYQQTLEWYHDGDEVSNASNTTSADTMSYLLVYWNYEGDSQNYTTYHPDDYYVRSYSQGKFSRNALVKQIKFQNDWAEIELVGHRDGAGRTETKDAWG